MTGTLEPGADYDRGAARLLAQTRFLTATFEAFERPLAAVAGVDEHRIRALALASPRAALSPRDRHRRRPGGRSPRTVGGGLRSARADAGPRGDRRGRDRGAARDRLSTSACTRASSRASRTSRAGSPAARALPVLARARIAAPGGEPRARSSCRDREEELAEFVRALKTRGRRRRRCDRTAIVFQRPLPYLYLARQVFADARRAVPGARLAAAGRRAVRRGGRHRVRRDRGGLHARRAARAAALPALRVRRADGAPITVADVHALDRYLVERKYLGGVERLAGARLQARSEPAFRRRRRVCRRQLCRRRGADRAELAAAARRRRPPRRSTASWRSSRGTSARRAATNRGSRATCARRAAVLSALHDAARRARGARSGAAVDRASSPAPSGDGSKGRRSRRVSAPRGVMLLDAARRALRRPRRAAHRRSQRSRLAGAEHRAASSIRSRCSASSGGRATRIGCRPSRARFQDLLRLPRRRVSLSTFTLEDDSIVSPSPLLEDVDAVGLPVERLIVAARDGRRPRVHARGARAGRAGRARRASTGEAADWLALRAVAHVRRAAIPRRDGRRARRRCTRSAGWSATSSARSSIYAAHVLKLPEERDEQAWMTPQERGSFRPRGVRELLPRVAAARPRRDHDGERRRRRSRCSRPSPTRHLDELPEGDRALERTLLLGSAAAAGFGERAFAFEIEDGIPRRRAAARAPARRHVHVRRRRHDAAGARCDRRRIASTCSQDGTLRIVDYKIGRAPERKRSLQLPIYGACAQQALDGRHGRTWTLARAGYIAFKEKTAFVELQNPAKAVAEGQERLLAVVDAVERGEFPVQPDEPFLCNWCAVSRASAARTTSETISDERSDVALRRRSPRPAPIAADRRCRGARRSRAIPPTTSSSKRRPGPARPACWSRAT